MDERLHFFLHCNVKLKTVAAPHTSSNGIRVQDLCTPTPQEARSFDQDRNSERSTNASRPASPVTRWLRGSVGSSEITGRSRTSRRKHLHCDGTITQKKSVISSGMVCSQEISRSLTPRFEFSRTTDSRKEDVRTSRQPPAIGSSHSPGGVLVKKSQPQPGPNRTSEGDSIGLVE